jgi:SAM-dependent methyltransferase
MKRILIRLVEHLSRFKNSLEWLAQCEAKIASSWASSAYRRLMLIQWLIPPQPEHFDHHIDLYYQWLKTRNPLWLERGSWGGLVLQGGEVLELACGDGFNARNFYSLRSRRVIACDFDPKAIMTAKKKNSAPNIEFLLADIRTDMPNGKYDNIICDAALEHFTLEEMDKLIRDVKLRLTDKGIFSGYTIVERPSGEKSLSHHEYEFKSKEDLFKIISPYFSKTIVYETVYPERHNIYYWASDSELPFTQAWPHSVTQGLD